MKLIDTIKLTGIIEVVTGLHIGGGNETVEIGGLDNQVIKNPKTGEPYIPGSSLKGKMRFLTEWKEGRLDKAKGDVHACEDSACKICRIFGSLKTLATENGSYRAPSRLLVRDAHLKEKFDPQTMLEVKYSTAIDRVTGTAKKGSLRNLERVTPGTQFEFEILYRVFDLDDGGKVDNENYQTVLEALMAVENDALGGSGSRGCGKVQFESLNLESKKHGKISGKSLSELYQNIKNNA